MDILELIKARVELDKESHKLHDIIQKKKRFAFFQTTRARELYPKGVDKNRLPTWIQARW